MLRSREQHLDSIVWDGCVPVAWNPNQLPDVDDVRPCRCWRCLAPARTGTRIVLHGHGIRLRNVLVPPALDDGRPTLEECWSRRYKCQNCQAVLTVLPVGVMPRFLYSAFAILSALFLVAERPIGEGLTDEEAYDRQGMNPIRGWNVMSENYRWRSIGRWVARIETWWPFATDSETLLTALLRRAGCRDHEPMMAAAIRSHVRWGAAM